MSDPNWQRLRKGAIGPNAGSHEAGVAMVNLAIGEGPTLDEQTVAAISSGRAEPALTLLVESFLEMRGWADRTAEAASGVFLERESPTAMAAGAFERVMAAIDAMEASQPVSAFGGGPRYPELIRLPSSLSDLVREAEARRDWSYAGPGIRSLRLGVEGPLQAELLRISPGASTPKHSHSGREFTLCLSGGFSDGRAAYGPGDLSMADSRTVHQPVADADGPCFVLAVTEGGLKFKGALGFIQRLTGA
ncbi:MAG: cupin domain-containing protein [Alphaproteobacteria bacterium]|nr:cupin domain-containing protein [Alphaproteobacteria bacterium]